MTASRGRAAVTYLVSRRAGSSPAQRLSFWLTRLGLWTMALLTIAVPVGATLRAMGHLEELAAVPRLERATVADAERLKWRSIGAGLPADAPPVVLAYHDVRPDPGDRYSVTPDMLERHLIALSEAGFRTISSADYAAYLRGGPAGPRSVYLTFDGGTGGLYRYADQILARQKTRAAAYLISGRMGTHRPYYLSWPEVHRMAGSGRWDFQAHTHDLRTRGPVGVDKKDGSLLTGRAWINGRLESEAEHAQRVRADVAAQLDDFARQDLPKPLLFAYPYSDLGASEDARIVDNTYAGAFTNNDRTVAPTSRRTSAGARIQRIEVFGDTQPAELVSRVSTWTAIPPGYTSPLKDAGRWSDTVPSIDVFRGQGAPPPGKSYLRATYAPYASADWTDYRVVTNVRDLVAKGNSANLTVRVGGTGSLTVRASYNGVQVVTESGAIATTIASDPGPSHRVEVTVTANSTQIRVDKESARTVQNKGGPQSTGGIGIALRRDAKTKLPAFTDLTVSALRPDSR